MGRKGDRFAIQQYCDLSDLAVIITSFRNVSVQNALKLVSVVFISESIK